MNPDFRTTLQAIPPVTRGLLFGTVAMTLLCNFGVFSIFTFVWNVDLALKGEVWRIVTSFFVFHPLGFGFLMSLMFLYRYGTTLERIYGSAAFLWMLVLCSVPILALGYYANIMIFSKTLVMVIIYVWSKQFPHEQILYMFAIQFESQYFPWVMILMNFLMGGFPVEDIIGMIVGHLYVYVRFFYPGTRGSSFFDGPSFLREYFTVSVRERHFENRESGGERRFIGRGTRLGE